MLQPYEQLEEVFGDYSVACNSGTAALHLALEGLNLPRGSCVVVPEFTMIACARAVTMAGLRPVFVDCDDYLNIDVGALPWYIKNNVSAIMAVHIYGRSCRMNEIFDMYLPVIEDMSEYHGRRPDDRSLAACYSFYKNKIICGEEGGLVRFTRCGDAQYARSLRTHGFTLEHDFRHIPYGHNYRLSNVHAQLILDSHARLQENLIGRARVEALYDKYMPTEFQMPKRDVCWVYDIKVPNNEWLVPELNKKGIQARFGFKPMSMQPEYLGHYRHLNAYKLSKQIMYFPVTPEMSEETVKSYVDTFLGLYGLLP